MYAVVTTDDVTDREAADQILMEQVIPMVKQAPEFVGGFWVRVEGGPSTSVIVLETKEQARAGHPRLAAGPPE